MYEAKPSGAWVICSECGMGRPAVIPRDGVGFSRLGATSVLFMYCLSFPAPWPSLPSLLLCQPSVEHMVCAGPCRRASVGRRRRRLCRAEMGHPCSPEGLQGCKVFGDLLYLSFQWRVFKCFLANCARHYQRRDEEDTVLLRGRSQVEGAPCLRRLGGTLQKTGTGADLEDRLRICQQDKHLLCESQSMRAARAP